MGMKSRKANAESRPGLRSAMKQGSTKRNGDAAMAGDTRAVMHNGGKSKTAKAPTGYLRSLMHQ